MTKKLFFVFLLFLILLFEILAQDGIFTPKIKFAYNKISSVEFNIKDSRKNTNAALKAAGEKILEE